MPDMATLLQQGADKAWFFIPSTILMGTLHGMEPGHSKTMMAALSMRPASRPWSGFGLLAAKAPYASGLLIMLVGLWVGWHGWSALA
jgi:nickel/cobalt transporter (NicO) family protein